MRALITNDDGIDSGGLRTLVRTAVACGLEVTVAAPDGERSGSSASLSALESQGRLLIEERVLDGVPGMTALSVHASPALIVFVGVRGAFGPAPDVVLAGINHGPNTGQAVLHSGTVGAALTAVTHDLPALAVSCAAAQPVHWKSPALVAGRAIAWLLAYRGPPFVLNVNVPDLPPGRLRGVRPAALASFGAVQARIGERGRGYLTTTFSETSEEAGPGSDVALLRQGWATITALEGPTGSEAVDLTQLAWDTGA
ncbi:MULTISPECIES: 5'/3'-nucleotidase SurE [Parafrankia]|uniref:5'-nucleotidase n=1 Tax=Parafrankia soli TaxID=2599596 RepID=A0A1S1Q1L3_9ACTN|nr:MULTISPECIES: 5'/3'-nucleotidase SurE [Parafrankia]OHV27870.1 5'/3'-nucleotidase SurE [Parafrankia soli]TCJ31991.1 5'/3'-nucleotidase SurE [Parafrankia sp. BMG5.11]CAI7976633.1 5'-nucleotidase [Frankia sp. Hr75.2]SQD96855.1 Survival protein SurE [Parafrankia sp. Ea1.12]